MEKSADARAVSHSEGEGTERAFTGKYDSTMNTASTVARLRARPVPFGGEVRLRTGWPSFTAPIAGENILTRPDNGFFSQRTECFAPGATDTRPRVRRRAEADRERYCMNSAALQFVATAK